MTYLGQSLEKGLVERVVWLENEAICVSSRRRSDLPGPGQRCLGPRRRGRRRARLREPPVWEWVGGWVGGWVDGLKERVARWLNGGIGRWAGGWEAEGPIPGGRRRRGCSYGWRWRCTTPIPTSTCRSVLASLHSPREAGQRWVRLGLLPS